jgi:hypothetical protein
LKKYKTMAFSLPQDLELRLQKVVHRARHERRLAEYLGLTPPIEALSVDSNGFTPTDYAALQSVVGRTSLTGTDLLSYVLLPNDAVTGDMRKRARRIIHDTRIRNRQVRKTAIVNLSRVVSALINLSLESLPAQETLDAPAKPSGRKGRNARQAA